MKKTSRNIDSSEKLAFLLSINHKAQDSLILQIKKQLTWLIASQVLKAGDTLPSVRWLALRLDVNMHTVRQAYHRLAAEGLIAMARKARACVLNFDPALFAEQSTKIKSHSIGIILPSMSNPFYQEFLKGVQSIAEKSNTLTLICSTYDDQALAWRYYAQLAASGVDGVLSVSHDMNDLLRVDVGTTQIPIVSVDYPSRVGYTVEIDHEKAGRIATRHLISHGFQRIALVRYHVDTPAVLQVQKGYQAALNEAGRAILPDCIIKVNGFDRASGEIAARKLLALPERPDAVYLIADQLAIGMIQEFQKLGISVPQEIGIASFNNIPEATLVTPTLTSVDIPTELLGKTAMSLLDDLVNGRPPERKRILISGSNLVIRQSCGCK